MKTNRKIFVLLISAFLITSLFSCQKKNDTEPATDTITFSLSSDDQLSTFKSALQDSIANDSVLFNSFQIMITVEDLNGQLVFKDKLIPLYSFGNSLVSGDYPEEFMRPKLTVYYSLP